MTSTPATPAPRPLAGGGVEELREVIAGNLLTARERTRLLTESVDDTDLVRQHSPLMSPLVWDLAHIANQEELWLLRNVGGREPMHPEIDPLYDAFEHPRAARPTLPLLTPAEARRYGHEVRARVLDLLEHHSFGGPEAPRQGEWGAGAPHAGGHRGGGPRGPAAFGGELTGPGSRFAFGMVAQHEVQHDETMLATHQLRS